MDWNKIKLVSLDVDGTLYSLRRMRWTFARVLFRRLGEEGPAAVSRDLLRIRAFHATARALRAQGGVFDPSAYPGLAAVEAAELPRWYGEAIRLAGPRDGLREFLEAIRARGIRVVACTDYRCGFKLEALGVEKAFERSYEGTRLGAFKPNALLIERVRADYGLGPEQLLHVGDHPVKDGQWGEKGLCRARILRHSFGELLGDPFFEGR